jgi:hypothetical protein
MGIHLRVPAEPRSSRGIEGAAIGIAEGGEPREGRCPIGGWQSWFALCALRVVVNNANDREWDVVLTGRRSSRRLVEALGGRTWYDVGG